MTKKTIYQTIVNIRYLIMFAIMDDFLCMEIENASGYIECEFTKVCSELYKIASKVDTHNPKSIRNFIDNESLCIAKSCIINAEYSFGVYSRGSDENNNVYDKYVECSSFLDNVIDDT